MLLKALAGFGAVNGAGEVEYVTLTGKSPAKFPPAAAGGRKLVMRRAVEAANDEGFAINACPSKFAAVVGESGGPKNPPSITIGTPAVVRLSLDSWKLSGEVLTMVGRTGCTCRQNVELGGTVFTLIEVLLLEIC